MTDTTEWETITPEDVKAGDTLRCTYEWDGRVNMPKYHSVFLPLANVSLDLSDPSLTLRRVKKPEPVTLEEAMAMLRAVTYADRRDVITDADRLLARYDRDRGH